ncbi:NADP(H)-dependent aldo-keto reductase [Uliginosibacterium sp. H3]|uniref:NADP(H)-dependent aldo-keto reductase n=1 Tax=Uliginosibacterium silvisoli TaxID=3114758 RepID=A0ABU6K908_9RHOO|nr:NADP(H)-dependent aldo-keto reductase [Uliginosibacterium sp. H3]
MEYRAFGTTDLKISTLTLGTMTWGEQNSEQDAHRQLDIAIDYGINLIDTAEAYPVPPRPETQGRTEEFIGSWLAKPGNAGKRDRFLVATKAAGPARQKHNPTHIRGGKTRHDKENLTQALDNSLRRLRSDYVDLYQLHWPDRTTNTFGQLSYQHVADEESVAIEETLSVLAGFVKAGKVRHIGVSNETPWGVAQFLKHAEFSGLPRIASIQNPYSLLNRSYETGLAEFGHREQLSLLAYSPLAFGVLTGKYLNGARPAGARLTLFERFVRYTGALAQLATADYAALARQHGLTPAQLAIAFSVGRPFVTSAIIGATTAEQLRDNIESASIKLDANVISAIDAIHTRYPNPIQ